ncbi:hypothetical protein D1BOALGB6SA_8196 [Olavius sp. associated proteobacterium Delta 1]|nr:hypothetical protein D1BOALGB6SA_8196 [Olavius sp. associated proteobacterium Delta 1]
MNGIGLWNLYEKDMDIYFSDDFVAHNSDEIEKFIEISLRHYQPADAFFRQFDACLRHDTVERLYRLAIPTLIMTDDVTLLGKEN